MSENSIPNGLPLNNAVKCNLTKLTTRSTVSVLVSMVSNFWHTSMRMAIVGQQLLLFGNPSRLGCLLSKVRIFYFLLM